MINKIIAGLTFYLASVLLLHAQQNSSEIDRLQELVRAAEKRAMQAEAVAKIAEKDAKNKRYVAVALEMAEQSVEIEDKELSSLLAVLAFNFNKDAQGDLFNNKIFSALSVAIKRYDQLAGNVATRNLVSKEKRTSAAMPYGRIKVEAHQNGSLRFINESGLTTRILSGHRAQVDQIEFNHSGDRMVTSGADNSIRIWNLSQLNVRPLVIKESAAIRNLTFSIDDKQIMYELATSPKTIKVQSLDMEEMASRLCTLVTRNLTKDEWMIYVGNDLDYESVCSLPAK